MSESNSIQNSTIPSAVPEGYHVRELNREEYRSYSKIWDPIIFDANQPVLHPKRTPEKEALREQLKARINENAWTLRLALFHGEDVAGWTYVNQEDADSVHMHSSVILPLHRRKGLYTFLLHEVVRRAANEGFEIVSSHHNPANTSILIAKLKAGFVVSGFSVNDIVGPLVRLSLFVEPNRRSAMEFRLGHAFATETILASLANPKKEPL